MLPYHVTDSVVLRLLQEHHAPELFALMERNRPYLRQWLSWLDGTTEVEHSRKFIRECLTSFIDTAAFVCGIWHQQKLCGVIGHNSINWEDRSANLGYWLAQDQQGNGIVTRCCRVFIDHAFTEYGLDRIELHIATENEKSQTVAYRLGFTRNGILANAEWMYDHFVDHTVNVLHRPAP
jgi:ribosomal-protein-serine acetyltransferase